MALILRGDEVEVCSKQVGFVGYAATVINNHGNQSYAVRYKNLVSEDDESQPLIEIVSADEVRPMPHTVSATKVMFGNSFCFLFSKTCFGEYK